MTSNEREVPDQAMIESVNDDRLAKWRQTLAENNATALVLVGIGHGETKDKVVLCTSKDATNDNLKSAVRYLYHAIVLEGKLF